MVHVKATCSKQMACGPLVRRKQRTRGELPESLRRVRHCHEWLIPLCLGRVPGHGRVMEWD